MDHWSKKKHFLLTTISVMLQQTESEPLLLKNIQAITNANGDLLLAPLLEKIIEKGCGEFDFDGQIIKYFSLPDQMFVLIGKFPISAELVVDKRELKKDKPLRIMVTAPKSAAKTPI